MRHGRPERQEREDKSTVIGIPTITPCDKERSKSRNPSRQELEDRTPHEKQGQSGEVQGRDRRGKNEKKRTKEERKRMDKIAKEEQQTRSRTTKARGGRQPRQRNFDGAKAAKAGSADWTQYFLYQLRQGREEQDEMLRNGRPQGQHLTRETSVVSQNPEARTEKGRRDKDSDGERKTYRQDREEGP